MTVVVLVMAVGVIGYEAVMGVMGRGRRAYLERYMTEGE